MQPATPALKTGELPERRTATSKTVRNEDGTLTTTAFLQPVHYQDGANGWKPIDSTLVAANAPGWAYRNKANSFGTTFRPTTASDFMRVSVPGGEVAVSLPDASAGRATTEKSRITYERPFPAADLRYDVMAASVKETIVLADRTAASTYRFRLESTNGSRLHAEPADGGGTEVWSATSSGPLFVLEPSWAAEARPDGEAQPESDPHASTSVTESNGGLDVVLQVDRAWLYAPERRFPVLVDPTITLQTPALDATLNPSCPTCTADNSRSWHSVGASGTAPWRSAMKFDLADLPGSANITDAQLQLFFHDMCILGGCASPHTVTAHRVTGAWMQGSPSSAFTHDATPLASVTSPTIDFAWLSWNVTSTTKDWLDGLAANEGILLRKTDETLNSDGLSLPARQYPEPALAPRLVVTYSGDAVDLAAPHTLHSNGAELEWTKFASTSGAPFDKYEVHRSLATPFTPTASTLLATIRDVNTTTYTDTTAAPGTAFTYKVVANSSPSNPRTVTLPPDGKAVKILQPGVGRASDTFIGRRTSYVNCANYGRMEKIEIDSTSEKLRRGLLRFDLRDVPAGVTLDSAVLSLWHPFWLVTAETINMHRVSADWVEGTGADRCSRDGATWYDAKGGVPWTAQGGSFDPAVSASVTHPAYEAPRWHDFGVTPLVASWLAGTHPNHGVTVKLADESPRNVSFIYWSADHTMTPSVRPKLVLTYSDGSKAKGPAVSVISPSAGAAVRGSAATLAVDATDDRRVERVEFLVDGVLKATDWIAPYALPWDSTTTANGNHTLTARAVDDAGNTVTSSAVGFTIDNTAPPTISISPPTAALYAGAVQADSPRAWWRLNETSGTTATDATGVHHGTYRGGTTKNVAGALAHDTGVAARFPGLVEGDDVAVPDHNNLDFGTGDFTVEAWVKTAVNWERAIMGKYSGANNARHWRVTVTDDPGYEGRIRAHLDDGSTAKSAYGPLIRVDDDRWHHVAVVFSRAGGMTVYVDGVSATTPGTPTGSVNNAEMLRVGDTGGYAGFQGDIDEAAVYASALTAARVRAHFDAGVIRGSHTIAATATDDVGVTKVEFYADGIRVGEDSTAPYSATFNTLDAASPVVDGPRTFTARAYDTSTQTTTSAGVVHTVANGGYSRHRATFSSTAVPPAVYYDPAVTPADSSGVDVSVTNTSGVTWPAGDVKLRYRWVSGDSPAVYTDGGPVTLAADLPSGGTATLRALVQPPALPDGVDRASYQLRFDMYDYAANAWFADKGNLPLDNPVIVNKIVTAGLGLERFYQYEGEQVGAGMEALTNVASGNMLLRWTPFQSPGRGLSTVVGLTYNSLEKGGDSPVGTNFSMGISSLTRLGSRLDVHPNNADSIAGRSNKWIQFTDSDGTSFRFEGETVSGATHWKEPPGVHLYLREYSTTDAAKKWALTRPDRVTFFFDAEGYPTGVEDGNGNRLHFTLTAVEPGDDPGGAAKRVTAVTDASGNATPAASNRSFNVDYYTKAEVKKARLRGKVQRITDHDGSALDFEYYEDGNLLRLIQRGGAPANAVAVPDRTFVFTYTNAAGDGPAIPSAASRINPDPKTSPQSSRLFSVRDPRGAETTFAYYGPTSAQKRWRLLSRTNREAAVTSFDYDLANRVATVTAPLSRTTKHAYDTEGKVTAITNPLNETTNLLWTADRMVSKVTEPTGKFTEFAYNDNGYLTDSWDQLRNRTQLEYTNLAVDANDVSGKWRLGRTIPHISQLAKKTDPKGTATSTPTDDFQWEFLYNTAGNLTSVSDPENKTTTYARNPDGTLLSSTSANGHTTSFTYDANGLVKSATDPRGKTTRFEWTDDGLLRWAQDANHASYTANNEATNPYHRTYNYYDAFHRPSRHSAPELGEAGRLIWTGVDYDPNDNVVKSLAPEFGSASGPATEAAYDDMDRPELVTGPDKTEDPLGERTKFVYDEAGRLKKQTSPRGVRTTAEDDFTVIYDYDDTDRVEWQSQVEGSGLTATTLTTHFCYDLAGDLRRIASPRAGTTYLCAAPTQAHTTELTYDDAHRRTSVKDGMGRTTSVAYDLNGNVKSQTDAAGNTTTIEYDQRNLPVTTVEPFITGAAPRSLTTRVEYDNVGNQKRLISPRAWDASSDKKTFSQYVTTLNYDELERLVRVDLPTSAADTRQLYIHRDYDNVGNMKVTTLPVEASALSSVPAADKTSAEYFDPGWVRTTTTDGRPLGVSYKYHATGQQASRTVPQAAGGEKREFWEYFHDGMLREHRDAGDARSEYRYNEDNLLRLATQRRAHSPDSAETTREVEAEYDGFNRTKKVRSRPYGAQTWSFSTMQYDENSNVKVRGDAGKEGATSAPARVTEFAYDAADWLTLTTDRGVVEPANDPADDQQIETFFTATGQERERKYSTKNALGSYALRQRTTWDHFANGKLKKVSTFNGDATPVELETHTVGYFDPANVYANGNRTVDTFKVLGPTSTAPCRSTTCTLTYTYDAKDRLVSTNNGRGTTTDFELTDSGALRRQKTNGVTTAEYNYLGGTLQSITAGGRTEQYWHDADGNLECVTVGGTKEDCGVAFETPPSPRLVKQNAYNYLSQVEGHRSFATDGTTSTAKDTSTYQHDALDRVVRQVEKHGAASTTIDFTYVGLSGLLATEAHSGARNKTLTYAYDAFGHRLTMHDARPGAATEKYSYGYDVHGNTSLLVNQPDSGSPGDTPGAAKAAYAYTPYGSEDAGLTQGDPESDNPLNHMRYSARRWDSGAKQLDMGARRYDSATSRFLQMDEFKGALSDLSLSTDPLTGNRHALAGGNPVGYKEWDGHISLPDGSAGSSAPYVGSARAAEHRVEQSATRTSRPGGGGAGGGGGGGDRNFIQKVGGYIAEDAKAVVQMPVDRFKAAYRCGRHFDCEAAWNILLASTPSGMGMAAINGAVDSSGVPQMLDGDWEGGLARLTATGIESLVTAGVGKAVGVTARAGTAAPRMAADDLGGAACSFSAATTVVMADGTRRAISEIAVGDYVLAEDPETGERGPRRVTHVWVHEDTVIDLEIDGDVVTTTEDHPFWNATDRGWQEAQDLDPGDLVRTAVGDLVNVDGLRLRTERRSIAFNLTVDGIHTYFVAVGEDEVLVHNTCLGPGKWMSPDEFADDLIRNTRNQYRHLPTETGQHGAGLRAAARDLRQQAQSGGYLPEIRDRLLRTAERWEARARGIDHPGR